MVKKGLSIEELKDELGLNGDIKPVNQDDFSKKIAKERELEETAFQQIMEKRENKKKNCYESHIERQKLKAIERDKNVKDPTNIGIYQWTNKETGKKYIGQSLNLKNRKSTFLRFAERYSGKRINEARHRYGSERYWDYEVLENCLPSQLNEREWFHINDKKTCDERNGYNEHLDILLKGYIEKLQNNLYGFNSNHISDSDRLLMEAQLDKTKKRLTAINNVHAKRRGKVLKELFEKCLVILKDNDNMDNDKIKKVTEMVATTVTNIGNVREDGY